MSAVPAARLAEAQRHLSAGRQLAALADALSAGVGHLGSTADPAGWLMVMYHYVLVHYLKALEKVRAVENRSHRDRLAWLRGEADLRTIETPYSTCHDLSRTARYEGGSPLAASKTAFIHDFARVRDVAIARLTAVGVQPVTKIEANIP